MKKKLEAFWDFFSSFPLLLLRNYPHKDCLLSCVVSG